MFQNGTYRFGCWILLCLSSPIASPHTGCIKHPGKRSSLSTALITILETTAPKRASRHQRRGAGTRECDFDCWNFGAILASHVGAGTSPGKIGNFISRKPTYYGMKNSRFLMWCLRRISALRPSRNRYWFRLIFFESSGESPSEEDWDEDE